MSIGVEEWPSWTATSADECRRFVRAAIAAHGGSEHPAKGDVIDATFSSPLACLEAAAEILRRAAGTEPSPSASIRVGIHTEPDGAERFAMVPLDRATRIREVAHLGQVVVSESTAELLDDLPEALSLRDLGTHRLRDLGVPQRLFGLEAEGVRRTFPKLRSLDDPELPNNLPSSLSAFVGRVEELAEVVGLLQASRLVTVAGAGGSGKTRLALQAAAQVLDGRGEGVWLVELAQVNEPSQIPEAISTALELRVDSEQTPTDTLLRKLREMSILIVLDNCEHVLGPVAQLVQQILEECPNVNLLTTSREPLGVDGEHVYGIRSLSLPPQDTDDLADFVGSDAGQLFATRMVGRDSTFTLDDRNVADAASVCRRLDGIPLAIELAAVPHGAMSLSELNRRLEQRFRLLTRGNGSALPRQQTLDAMISWSYDMLTNSERAVLRHLSVFVDGFDLEAAQAVCTTAGAVVDDVGEILSLLVTKSLVIAERVSGTMWYSLHEVIRQFAALRLVHDDGDAHAGEVRRCHAAHYLWLCERAAPSLLAGDEQVEWMYRFDRNWGNIMAALAHFGWEHDGVESTVRLVSSLAYFDISRGHRQPYAALQGVLERTRECTPELRCRALVAWARCAGVFDSDLRGVLEASTAALEEAVLIARQVGARRLEVEALVELARALFLLERTGASMARAEEGLELAREHGDPLLQARMHTQLGMVQWTADPDTATAHHLQALDLYRSSSDRIGECTQLMLLAIHGFETIQDAVDGRSMLEKAVELATRLGSSAQLVYLWGNLAITCAILDDYEAAEEYCRLNLRAVRRLGVTRGFLTYDMMVMSHCAAGRGDARLAAQLAGASDAFWNDVARPVEFTLTPLELELIARNNAALAHELGREEFDRLFASGQQLSVDKAVDLALGRVAVSA